MWAGDGQYRCLSVHALCLTSAVSPVFSLNSIYSCSLRCQQLETGCLKPEAGEVHIVSLYVYICTCIYIFIFFSLTAFHPDQPERGTGSGHWCCLWVRALRFLSVLIFVAGCLHMYVVCVSVYTYVLVLIGNMCSALLWAGPGDMELWQPHLLSATRFGSS